MLTELDHQTIDRVRNSVFRQYAEKYIHIQDRFLEQVRQLGVDFAPPEDPQEYFQRADALAAAGATVRNDAKSIVANHISPGCLACQTGQGSSTFFISLKCHRNCFFCFNPNQENYEFFRDHTVDVIAELQKLYTSGQAVHQLALTGGEPLLYKPETVQFFKTARQLFPKAYTRLYTCGDQIDEATLQALKDAGLDEIRFSIRMYDLEKGRQFTMSRIAMAKEFIPYVMVEMPVLPGTLEEMKSVLQRLDEIGIFSINLLEFCFPLTNAEAYRQRGYLIKARPFRVLYNYWYAGGLPVAGSETVCLDLLDFALQSGLKMGVHYCSLENKQTGQVYRQNKDQSVPRHLYFSERDYFLKSAKVFGEDIAPVETVLRKKGVTTIVQNRDQGYLEFPVKKLHLIRNLDVEVGISTNILEVRNGEKVLRELKIDWTTPQQFNFEKDI
jgi:pyruvate formate-lyase activating enzyme-like uncharacterized protein